MFTELAGMLNEGDALSISVVAGKGGWLTLIVRPVGEFKDLALATPLKMEGTPAEFDAELAAEILGWVDRRLSLKAQIETQTLVLAEAERASKEATAKAISKATTPTKAALPALKATKAAAAPDVDADDEDEQDDRATDTKVEVGAPAVPHAGQVAAPPAVELF